MEWVMIAVGGGIGAWLRYMVALVVGKWNQSRFPSATFIVNLAGSFLMGMAYGSGDFGPAVSTGFLGALTTFSTFMYEAVTIATKRLWLSVVYIILSLVSGLFMVAVGYMIAV
ncbi:fluoride efflux transporter FluC [Pseudalkalibacillus hwajinpoensis]|uniref:Fluoride-specific ion channel FluC n=1 Tax=Guptibacillus hwajinpoensis TaxID=208199 RepID=A0A4U1MCZ1_9BACL|nr:CrcB family protein [Pseudalkalibacillus hwajinpoensis]TKD67930.1 CrcB family protein [Pseudalkalibacillus hwajinpoensis]